MDFIRFFAKKSILVNLLVVFVTLIGIYTFLTSAKEVFPQIKIGYLVISTTYAQAGPEEIESLITIPLENAIENVRDIKEVTSWTSEGLSMIGIELEPNVKDTKAVLEDVKAEVDKVNDLPEEAEDPNVFEITTDFFPLISVSVSGGENYGQLRDTAKFLEDKIKKVKGVGDVVKSGYYDKAIWVDADKKRLEQYGLTLSNFISVLQDRDISMPAGNKVFNGKENAIRMLMPMENVHDVNKVIIRSNETGHNVRVRDVAEVTNGFKDQDYYIRSQGSRAILMQVQKKKGYDSIKMVQGIRQLVKANQANLPAKVKVAFSNDISIYLKNRLDVLYSNGLFGALLVIIMLIVLLRPSVAVMTALGMPVAFATAFYVSKLLHVDLNMISILGYIMVLGMLVDDAIVVGENVYSHMERGSSPFEAAVTGAKEMFWPVLGSVTTTIAAFLPLMLIGGIMGEFLSAIPKVIIIALAASLVECFFILPSHLADFVKPKKEHLLENRKEHWFSLLRNGYGKALKAVLRHRVWFALLILALMVAATVLEMKNGFIFTDAQSQVINITLKTDNDYSVDDTEKVVKAIEKKVMQLNKRDLDVVNSTVGMIDERNGPPQFAPNKAQLNVQLHIQDKRKTKDVDVIVKHLRQWIGKPKGVEDITIEALKGGPSTGAAIDISLSGDHYAELTKVSRSLMAAIKNITMPEKGHRKKGDGQSTFKPVKDIKNDFDEGKKEIRLVIDEQKAMLTGVNLNQAAMVLRAAVAGIKLKTIKKLGEDTDVMIRMQEDSIKTLNQLLQLHVPNRYGDRIPLKEIVRVERGRSFATLKHKDGRKSISVLGSIDKLKTNANAVNQKIEALLKTFRKKFANIDFEIGGEQKEMMEGFQDLGRAFIVAFLLIFIILATLFDSLLQPAIIMLAIPFGFIGVMLTLYLHGMPISFMAFMGFVGLTGVVVNDSLIMVSFINSLVAQGMPFEKALVEGAKSRLRPVILTTSTTAVGLFPLAYGWFGGSEPMIAPMALVFAWGLIFATVVTLFIIPSFMAIVHNLKVTVAKLMKKDTSSDYVFRKQK